MKVFERACLEVFGVVFVVFITVFVHSLLFSPLLSFDVFISFYFYLIDCNWFASFSLLLSFDSF